MNRICVYTCLTGEYEKLSEIKKESGIDYICYTNNKKIISNTWNVKYIDSDEKLGNHKLARKIKILGTEELKKYDIVVWCDAQITFTKSIKKFIKQFVDIKTYDLVGLKHYCREKVFDEIDACLVSKKDSFESLKKSQEYLVNNNYPDNNGLMETGVIFRDFKNEKVQASMKLWFEILSKYSHRDQLSFNFSAWKNNLKVNLLEINQWDNEFFKAGVHTPYKIECDIIKFNNDLLHEKKEETIFIENGNLKLKLKFEKHVNKVWILPKYNGMITFTKFKNKHKNCIINCFNCANLAGDVVFSSYPIIEVKLHGDVSINIPVLFDNGVCNYTSVATKLHNDLADKVDYIRRIEEEKELLQDKNSLLTAENNKLLNEFKLLKESEVKYRTNYENIVKSRRWKIINGIANIFSFKNKK